MTDLSAYAAAAEKAFEQTKQLLSDNGASHLNSSTQPMLLFHRFI